MMNRQRNILLAITFGIFLFLAVMMVYARMQFSQSHYTVGKIPQNVIDQILPKDVPTDSIRPPALRPEDPVRYGSATSVASVIVFGDFQCQYCRDVHSIVDNVVASYHGDVRLVWRDFPLEDSHPQALPAAVFARCAGQQGKFWGAYDQLMAAPELNDQTYRNIAYQLKLDDRQLSACQKDPAVTAAIRQDYQEWRGEGIKDVPFIFVGSRGAAGMTDTDTLKKAIDSWIASI